MPGRERARSFPARVCGKRAGAGVAAGRRRAAGGRGAERHGQEAYRLGRAGGVCRAALAAGETVPAAQLIPDYHRLSQAERERAARLQAAP